MKKPLLLFVCIILPFFLSASKTTFGFSHGKDANYLTTRFSGNGIKYKVRLSQNEDGKFNFEVPPFINIHTGSGFSIGEIRLGSFAYFALNPMKSRAFGYSEKEIVKTSFSPSFEPSFSGLAKTFRNKGNKGNSAVAVFNPLFNGKSPSGVMGIYENGNFFVGVFELNSNGYEAKSLKQKYQERWKTIPVFKNQYRLLAGGLSDFKMGKVNIKTDGFTDAVFDSALGYWGYYGWDIRLKSRTFTVDVSKRLNSSDSEKDPRQFLSFGAEVKNGVSLSFSYTDELFPLPVYGGTSAKEVITYCVGAKYLKIKFNAEHTYTTEESTGHSCTSVYSFSAGSFKRGNNRFSFKAEINLGRTDTVEIFVKKFTCTLRDKNAKLEFSGEKTGLTLSAQTYICGIGCKFSLTQDRVFTISASINR